MKTFSTSLAASYASRGATLCLCMRVARRDGIVVAFTSCDIPVIVGGETYQPAAGFAFTSLVSSATTDVDNMTITIFPDETTYPAVDIIAGRWDRSPFWLFECDYTSNLSAGSPIGTGTRNDVNLLKRGWTGDADTIRSANQFEFLGLKQSLQQGIGEVTSKTCKYRLGSTAKPEGLCLVNLTPFTKTYTVTAVDGISPRRKFTCSSATETADWYMEGVATSDDGENAGYSQKIKAFAAGVFTLSLEMPFDVGIGDTFTVVAGCQKRLAEDCLAKFNNVLNFGGEPHVPGADLLTADPSVTKA